MDRADKVFTVVFTSCFLAVEFITSYWGWSRKGEILWWLLLPAAVCVALIVILRRANHDDGQGK
jgi:hypothetical protein